MLKKFCNKAGCKELVPQGQKYCDKHQKEYEARQEQSERERQKKYDKGIRYTRDKKYHKFYCSDDWLVTRAVAVKRDKGLCQECLKNGRVRAYKLVHHIKPLKTHWHLRLTLSNLECVCERCHQRLERELREVEHERTSKEGPD